MLVRMRYIVEKRNRNGASRWYWQRSGFPTKRLPDDEAERLKAVTALNDRADAEKSGEIGPDEPEFGSIAWAFEEYRKSRIFAGKAAGTRRVYERWVISLTETVGHQPITTLPPKAVHDILDGIDSKGGKKHCAAVLKRVAQVAIRRGLLDRNPATLLDLEGSNRREEIWGEDDIEKFLAACEGELHGEAIALGFQIMLHAAMRPGDMRKITWQAYNGDTIKYTQTKTKKLVEVPCNEALLQLLGSAKTKRIGTVIVAGRDGQRLTKVAWQRAFATIRRKAGRDHLQARDLRRTFVVNAARAGATVPEIAASTGHSIDHTQAIFENYLPRDVHMARAGIIKMERAK